MSKRGGAGPLSQGTALGRSPVWASSPVLALERSGGGVGGQGSVTRTPLQPPLPSDVTTLASPPDPLPDQELWSLVPLGLSPKLGHRCVTSGK